MLVVADEIFTMGDKQLSHHTRLSVPNTLKESNLMKQSKVNNTDTSFGNPKTLY